MKAKNSGKKILKMPDPAIRTASKGTLAMISVVTGYSLPDTSNQEGEMIMGIIVDQLSKVLIERYRTLTFEEIRYAFRNYADQVKDWGKNFNINLFHEVMKLYLEDRAFAIDDEEKMIELPPAELNKPDIKDTRRVMVENAYQDFLNGSTSFNPLPTTGIDILMEDRETFFAEEEFLKGELIEDFIIKAREKLMWSAADIQAKGWKDEIKELKTDGNVKVENLSRKMALMKAFYDFKNSGFINIYVIKKVPNGK